MGDPGFFLQDQLRIARNPRRKLGRQRNRLIQRIGVQRLRAPQRRRHRLIGGADHVVIGVLLLQRHARGLAMGAQHQAACLLRLKLLHDARPQHPRRPQLRRFHKEIHANGEKERQAACEIIHIHAPRNRRAHIFPPIGQRKGQLLHKVRPGLLHVIARDRDRVELGHLRAGKLDDIRNDPHRGFGRIDIGVAHHELFQNVILNGPRKGRARHALLFAGHDEIGEDRDHRAIHRHRHADLVQRNPVEQDLHILNAINRHARLANIAHHARVVRVIAPVRCQIEGHRNALLPRRQRLAVKRVGFLRRREAGILPDRPRTARIHRRLHAARKGCQPGHLAHLGQARHIGGGVKGLDLNPFQRVPAEAFRVRTLQFLGRQRAPCVQIFGHRGLPSVWRAWAARNSHWYWRSPRLYLGWRCHENALHPCSVVACAIHALGRGRARACRTADASQHIRRTHLGC